MLNWCEKICRLTVKDSNMKKRDIIEGISVPES